MINFNFSKECYSCSACANICGKNAIHFDNNLLPSVNSSLCVNCGLCECVCVKMNETEYFPQLAESVSGYVCKNKNEKERFSSSSGGIFILLAQRILAKHGYVCGCIYDENFIPKHVLSNEISVVKKMMGSKYVKSDMGFCIREMENLLKQGKPVLFSGVPCQTAAVNICLGKYSSLYIVNIVCHGSIEREFWESYLAEERKTGTIVGLTMRDKSKGWSNYGLKVQFADGSEHITFRNQDGYFLQCFTEGLFERCRCLNCKYKGTNIVGDILLGDGWGMEQVFPDFYDAMGLSSVVTLSAKGKELFADIQENTNTKAVDTTQIIARNQRIVLPAPKHPFADRFQKHCRKNPDKLNVFCKKYAKPTLINRIIKKVVSGVKK